MAKILCFSLLIASFSALAQDPPRCGNNNCYCYVDPYSKAIVCRNYPQ